MSAAGWRIERWTLTSADEGEWQGLPPWPFRRLDDAIALVRAGDRIVNVLTGRVVLEA